MSVNRAARVSFQGHVAGVLQEHERGFTFTYDEQYLKMSRPPIGFGFSLRAEAFQFDTMPAYFENLVSEGWLRKVQAQSQRISEDDRFGLLLENGRDLVGAITVVPLKGDEGE